VRRPFGKVYSSIKKIVTQLATQEAEIRSQPQENSSPDPIWKKIITKTDWQEWLKW
jgi:hypothetical protein